MLTGRITSIHGRRAHQRGRRRLRPARPVARGRPHARVRLLRGRLLARHAERDRQRRRCATSWPNPFYPVNNSYTTVTEDEPVRHLGRWQPVQAGDADRHQAVSTFSIRRAPTPTTRTEQPRAERRLRLAAAGARQRLRRGCCSGREEGDSVIRGGVGDGVPAARHVRLHRRVRREPGASRST